MALKDRTDEELIAMANAKSGADTNGGLSSVSDEELVAMAQKKDPSLLQKVGQVAGEIATGAASTISNVSSMIRGEEGDILDPLKTAGKTAALVSSPLDKEDFKDTPLLEAAGDIVGGIGGLALTKSRKGAAAGAGLLGAFGRVVDDELRQLLGVLPESDQSFFARLENAGESGIMALLGEGLPAALSSTGKKILGPFKNSLSKRAKDALAFSRTHKDIVEDVFGRGDVLPFLPAQATDVNAGSSLANLMDTAQNMVEKSIFGGGPLLSRNIGNAKVNEIILRRTLDAIDKVDMDPTDLGTLLRKAAEGNDTLLNRIINTGYNKVARRLKGKTTTVLLDEKPIRGVISTKATGVATARAKKKVGIIKMSEPQRLAKKISDLGQKVNGIGKTEQGFDVADKLVTLLKQDRGHVDYETAQLLRSTYATKLRNRINAKETGPINAVLNELVSSIDKSIEQSLKRVDPLAFRLWNNVKSLRKRKGDVFQNDLIVELLDTAPNKSNNTAKTFVDAWLGTGDSLDVEIIQKIKAATKGNPKVWAKAKRFITQKMLVESADTGLSQVAINSGQLGQEAGEGLLLKGDKLEQLLLGRGGMGREVLEEVYTPQELKTLKGVANSLAVSQAKQNQGTGGMFIQLAQGGALVGVGGARAAPILILPPLIGKILTGPNTGRWLTEGLQAPAGSQLVIQSFAKLSAAITNLKREERTRKIKTTNRRLQLGKN